MAHEAGVKASEQNRYREGIPAVVKGWTEEDGAEYAKVERENEGKGLCSRCSGTCCIKYQ